MTEHPPVPHAAHHLAELIVRGSEASEDPKTIAAWAKTTAHSVGSLRSCCHAAGTTSKAALDFTRALRALRLWPTVPDWSLLDLFDMGDERTLGRLLRRGGVQAVFANRLTIEQLIEIQLYLPKGVLLREVERLIRRQ